MVNILIGFVVLATLMTICALFPVQVVGVILGGCALGVCWMLGDMIKGSFF